MPAGAGLLVSLTYMTRYIGLSLLGDRGSGFLCLLENLEGTADKNRLVPAVTGLAGGITWVIRNMLVSGNAANRSLLYHPLTGDKLQEGTQTLISFLFPERFNLYSLSPRICDGLAVLVIFGVIGLVFLFWRNSRRSSLDTLGISNTDLLSLSLSRRSFILSFCCYP